MSLGGRAGVWLAALATGQVRTKPITRRKSRQTGAPSSRGLARWLGDPRAAVLIVMAIIVVFGGGRKLLRGWRARGVVGRLGEPDVSVQDVTAAVEFGRDGLMDLFRILATADSAELRGAAGHAISVIWARDDLIAEEEQALVRRGFHVAWRARRRYPRGLRGAIPIAVSYGVPFLKEGGGGVAPTNLEWSHTILGARRATLESPTAWKAGPGLAEFTLMPDDFTTDGPHKLVLHARVRTAGLSESWELALPQMPLSFEFDPLLSVDALFTLADAARGDAIASAVRLVAPKPDEGRAATFLDLDETMALRDPPMLSVTTPLPCDLAHTIELEFDGVPGRFGAGEVVVSGQGARTGSPEALAVRLLPLGRIGPMSMENPLPPGRRGLRAILTANADRGWADPDIRSIWPGSITTDWVEVEVVRR